LASNNKQGNTKILSQNKYTAYTQLRPLVISVVRNFQARLDDYSEAALDACVKCASSGIQLVGAVTDHLNAQLSSLAHYSDQSVFKRHEGMDAKGLRFLGWACHKLNLGVNDFRKDPDGAIPLTIFTDVTSHDSVSFEVMADDLKQLSKCPNSKSIQAAFRMPCPVFCPTRWTNLIRIAVFVTRKYSRFWLSHWSLLASFLTAHLPKFR
jgi:hypothetical protein